MPFPKLIDQIDHLFEQLIREPWSRPLAPGERMRGEHVLELTLPIGGCERGHMSVTVEGRQLNVALRRRCAPDESGAAQHEEQRQSFLLPEDADVSTLEARFEGDTLRVRVGLRPRRKEK
jgi:HSP20 family molecular chaperone IbpA